MIAQYRLLHSLTVHDDDDDDDDDDPYWERPSVYPTCFCGQLYHNCEFIPDGPP